MTRKVIDMNVRIFLRLDEHCVNLERPLRNAGKKRYIKTNKAEKFFSAEAELKERFFSESERQVVVLEHRSKVFYCLVGFRFLAPVTTMGIFIQTENNAGLMTVLCDQGGLRPQVFGEKLNEIIDVGHMEDDLDYEGHLYTQLETIYSPITIYEADITEYLNGGTQVIRFCLLEKQGDPSTIDEAVTREIEGLVKLGIEALPIETISRSLFDADPGSLFLALYRCFEAIYSVRACKNLGNSLGLSIPWQEISQSLEVELSWRPREQSSLATLLAPVKPDTLAAILKAVGPNEAEPTNDNVARVVYNLRNRLVHFRPGMQLDTERNDINWSDLYIGMIAALKETYLAIEN
jgi:hypothetical protein